MTLKLSDEEKAQRATARKARKAAARKQKRTREPSRAKIVGALGVPAGTLPVGAMLMLDGDLLQVHSIETEYIITDVMEGQAARYQRPVALNILVKPLVMEASINLVNA